MFDNLKSNFKKKNRDKPIFTKRKLVVGMTSLLLFTIGLSVISFNPGNILPSSIKDSVKKVSLPILSKSNGPVLDVPIEEKNQGRNTNQNNQHRSQQNNTSSFPFLPQNLNTPSSDFYNHLPTNLPSFTNKPSNPTFSPNSNNSVNTGKYDSSIVYARHADITTRMRDGLSLLFKLEKFSDFPKDSSIGRFSTSYVISSNGITSEKFELMSIARNSSMESIKTAKDALNALIEESDSVNTIEENDSYVIYELAGNKGYQIGKIFQDEQGIYILGYVNLTTNNMPNSLKIGWINKIRDL